MTPEYIFHIRNASPDDTVAVLMVLENHPKLATVAEIVLCADNMGFSIRDRQRLEALMTARDLGLIEKSYNKLTEQGQLILNIEMYKPSVFAEIMHGLLFSCWESQKPTINCFSWSYRTLCQILWSTGSIEISNRRELASKIETQAREYFNHSNITFSSKSIGGAFLWLEVLEPNIIEQATNRFSRRAFCSPELFIMAINFVYEESHIDYGANLLLTDANKEFVCQMCLLEPGSFDRVLEYAIAQFGFLERGIGGGWGEYVTLHRQPELRDFI